MYLGKQLNGPQLILTGVDQNSASELLIAFNGDPAFNQISGGLLLMTKEAVITDISDTLNMPGGAVWKITLRNGILIGVAETALIPPPQSAWIALLIICQKYQGKGYGRESATLLEEFLFQEPQITTIGLGISAENGRGLRFWERQGYSQGLHRRDAFGNEIITMKKRKP
jgi:RimJ/RimL family protein N-acetyltransferase